MSLKRKIYILITIFCGLTVLLIVFVISPLFLEIKKNSQNILSQRQTLAALEGKAENLEKFRIIFPEIFPGLEKIDNLFVDSKVPIDFIRFLEQTSQASGLSLKISAGPALKIEKDLWPSISFQLSLAGSFSSLARFLEKLESSLYLIEIQNLTISRLSETELTQPFLKKELGEMYSLGDIKAVISIKVYTK